MNKKISKQTISLDSSITKKLSTQSVSEITVRRIVDTGKVVKAFVNGFGVITLFEGDTYNPNWTESDAINKLNEGI